LARCRPGWAHVHPDRNTYRTNSHAYSYPDRNTHTDCDTDCDTHGHADLAARSPNADLNSNGYADGHLVCHPDGDTHPHRYSHG
jgi:hypothetical protein